MKILLVTGSFPPDRCGVGDYSCSLAKALIDRSGVRVAVLTSVSCGRKGTQDGIEIFPVVDGWRLTQISRVLKVIRGWAPDIVHIQYPTQGYGGGLLPWFLPMIACLLGKKVVQTWHEGYSWRGTMELLLKAAVPSRLVVVRPRYIENIRPLFRWLLSRKKFLFIPNASSIPKAHLDNRQHQVLRDKYMNGQNRLIVYFGFVYPNKGIELLFEIANPSTDQIVIAGEYEKSGEYGKRILDKAATEPWKGKVTVTGFLPAKGAADLLAVADAVVLPFRDGGGEWNTSIHASVLQGTLVITTSLVRNGYDQKYNIYYAQVDNLQEMKSTLDVYAGRRREYADDLDGDEWQQIVAKHLALYGTLLQAR